MIECKLDAKRAEAKLRALIDGLQNREGFFKVWGKAVEREAQRSARSHSRGGRFWKSIADLTKMTSVNASGAIVQCLHEAGRHKHTGGTIRAPGCGPNSHHADTLTIPIHELAEGKFVGELELEGIEVFRPKGTNILATTQNQELVPLYALVRSVDQDPEPWWPEEHWALAQGVKIAEKQLGDQVARG